MVPLVVHTDLQTLLSTSLSQFPVLASFLVLSDNTRYPVLDSAHSGAPCPPYYTLAAVWEEAVSDPMDPMEDRQTQRQSLIDRKLSLISWRVNVQVRVQIQLGSGPRRNTLRWSSKSGHL